MGDVGVLWCGVLWGWCGGGRVGGVMGCRIVVKGKRKIRKGVWYEDVYVLKYSYYILMYPFQVIICLHIATRHIN